MIMGEGNIKYLLSDLHNEFRKMQFEYLESSYDSEKYIEEKLLSTNNQITRLIMIDLKMRKEALQKEKTKKIFAEQENRKMDIMRKIKQGKL